jgi:hypothetical protein
VVCVLGLQGVEFGILLYGKIGVIARHHGFDVGFFVSSGVFLVFDSIARWCLLGLTVTQWFFLISFDC